MEGLGHSGDDDSVEGEVVLMRDIIRKNTAVQGLGDYLGTNQRSR